MGRKGEATRKRILDTAQALVLERGFAGVSVDQIISRMGLTKGAFFHHFKTKEELALALIQRYSDQGIGLFKEFQIRAQKLSDDPLQQLLIFVGLYEELFEGLKEPYPGCLLASYVYELHQFNEETRTMINTEFQLSRTELTAWIRRIAKQYPPRGKVQPKVLADAFMACIEGAFILSKSLNEPQITAQQLHLYRNFLEVLYQRENSGPPQNISSGAMA